MGRSWIEPTVVRTMAERVGLASPTVYLACAAYWICVNSVLEEYVWRWFVVDQCRPFIGATAAIFVSALGFTLHHIIAMQIYFGAQLVILGALGSFLHGTLGQVAGKLL